eukprot:Phypoly_transcript_04682.p1 GENE.Phypoly_transcript_04682~~Phypoly_transcript_04682.p1  ORF type:complete len:686 (+),score=202.70 Phypoly_transcript_04682:116-2059(+)
MTPRVGATPARGSSSGRGGGLNRSTGGGRGDDDDQPISNPVRPVKQKRQHDEDAAARQKARKWQKGKEKEAPSGPRYRDRARERRDDSNPDYQDTEAQLASFHSVPPPEAAASKADLHKMSIENSKYLGGDMEHTHLVKGLDFALLAKIKSENQQKEKEDKEKALQELEVQQEKAQKQSGLPPMKAPTVASAIGAKKVEAPAATTITAITPMGKSIFRLIQKNTITRNEQFLPGRMAFVFDLEDDFPQELPTTLLRSKEDCPREVNSLVGKVDPALLEKVAKVMNFLRQGSKTHKKMKKKEKPAPDAKVEEKPAPAKPVVEDDDIFGDAGTDYVVTKPKKEEEEKKEKKEEKTPSKKEHESRDEKRDDRKREDDRKSDRRDDRDRREDRERRDDRDRRDERDRREDREDRRESRRDEKRDERRDERDRERRDDRDRRDERRDERKREDREKEEKEKDKKKSSYFQTPAETQEDQYSAGDKIAREALEQARQLTAKLNPNDPALQEEKKQAKKAKDDKKDPNFVEDTYSECYPGSYEMATYAYESDDEEDITKMDMGGSKKGKLKRWDFDDEESWNAYNDQREAMPKAAFQFGVKMSDGRKTRRNTKDNKDAQKINTILKQRAVDSVQAKKLPDNAEPRGKRRRTDDD